MESGLTSAAFTTAAGEVLKDIGVVGSVGLAWLFNPVPLGINNRIIRPEYISKEEAEYMKERYPEYYSSISQNRYFEVDETRSNLWSTEQKEKVDRGALYFYAEKNNKELETAREIGGAVGTVAVMGWNMAKYSSAEKLGFNSENYTGNSNNFNKKPPLDLIEIDGIYQVPEYPAVVLKSGGSLVPVTNTNTSLVPFNPNASTGMSVTNLPSAGIIGGIVVPNLITSGKSVTVLEAPKNPVVKPVTKVEQNIETVKQPAVTSEKPKTVERSHSQGSNNHNSNKESFNQKRKTGENKSDNGDLYYEGRKVYTASELNQLGRGSNATPNRGVEYIFEKPAGKPEAQEFQWGTTGSMMQQTPDGPKNVIPALRYDNPNSRGMNFIKFDGIEVRDGTTYLIDAKRNVPHWNKSAMKNLEKTFRRINEAKNQNPEIKVIYEFPNEKAKIKFTDWLDKNPKYKKTIDEIRIRPEK